MSTSLPPEHWLADAARTDRVAAPAGRQPAIAAQARRRDPEQVPAELTEPPAVALVPVEVDPDERPTYGVARLDVQRARDEDGDEMFVLTGYSGDSGLQFRSGSRQLRPHGIALKNVRDGGTRPSEICRAIQRWSRNQDRLIDWINRLRAEYGADLRLVIWDDTDYDIPWELLWLDSGQSWDLPPPVLGALVTVTRWTTIHDVGARTPYAPADCTGEVVGYYDTEMRGDTAAFRRFVHRQHFRMGDFLTELARKEVRAGLAYIGCHGVHGSTVHELRLGPYTWLELEAREMAALSERRTLVVINACDSGRVVLNKHLGEKALRGFAELFLRKRAGGCIVSSGEIATDVARSMAEALARHAVEQPHRPVADFLREFRARAAALLPNPLPDTQDDDGKPVVHAQQQVLPFLYSFMFLYYGHPCTTLRLLQQTMGDEA